MGTSLMEGRMEESMAGERQKKSKTKVAFIDARDLPETSTQLLELDGNVRRIEKTQTVKRMEEKECSRKQHSKKEQRKGANSEKLEILLPKNDKTLEEGIRLPTMEDLYFQRNDKTLKEVPRQHCQATALRTLKKVISSKMGLQHLEQLQEWKKNDNDPRNQEKSRIKKDEIVSYR